ncbi:MAG: hypothetical protein ACI8UO_002212 [Verrucomicrobiales bacterium]|jgi:hypothetical protein
MLKFIGFIIGAVLGLFIVYQFALTTEERFTIQFFRAVKDMDSSVGIPSSFWTSWAAIKLGIGGLLGGLGVAAFVGAVRGR